MFDWIRGLPNGAMCLLIISVGMLCWALFAAAYVGYFTFKNTLVCRYGKLKRENARLKKYISELRRECLCGKSK